VSNKQPTVELWKSSFEAALVIVFCLCCALILFAATNMHEQILPFVLYWKGFLTFYLAVLALAAVICGVRMLVRLVRRLWQRAREGVRP
jgi:hypothetical protein